MSPGSAVPVGRCGMWETARDEKPGRAPPRHATAHALGLASMDHVHASTTCSRSHLAVPEQTRFSYEHQIRMQIRFYTGVQNARRAGTVVR